MVKAYYLTGPDGSGKTLYLKQIENYYAAKGITTNHIWLRSPKILSKPLMAYCRLVGLTKYKYVNGVKYGWHEFYRSKFVSLLFPWLQLIDFRIKLLYHGRVLKGNSIVLMDRFSLDTLADLMVDTEKYSLHKTKLGKAFLNFIPQETVVICLSTKENMIRMRKQDTLHDPVLSKKIKAYEVLSNDLKLKIIDNNREYFTVKEEILELLELEERGHI